MYGSLSLTSAICASLCLHPVATQGRTPSTLTEDAAAFAFLRGATISSTIRSYCLNMQLLQVGDGARFAKPADDRRSPKARAFLRDLEIVSAKGAALPAREIAEESLRGAGFNARAATFEECTDIPTVRLYRPMIQKTKAVVFAHVISKCGAITAGESFHLNSTDWERRHLAYYYPVVGPPGCSHISKVMPGKRTDKLFVLER